MTESEWHAFERGMRNGTIDAKLAVEVLRRMSQNWTYAFQNVEGVPRKTIEIQKAILRFDDLIGAQPH